MGEGLEEFAMDLTNLVEAAYPENAFGMDLASIKLDDEQRTGLKGENEKMVKRFKEEICMERFKAGLLPELREKIIFMKAPSSLAEAIAQAKRVDELNRTIKDDTRKRLEKIEVKAALAEINEVRDPYQNDDQYYYEEQFQESNGCGENWGEDDENWGEQIDLNFDPYYDNDQNYDDESQWFPHESNENWGEEYYQDQGYQNWPTDGTDFEEF
ncbi:unnamed protein product [Meloidogyne enterolobii]|uniref:Uncharacterized protein n=1 Tax=Meloidogyne enterolobii TaxID=390850 RepID=A0ACB1AJZ6_MELEN